MAQAAEKNVFRIATINVHSFRNPWKAETNAKDLANLLKPLDLDLVAVEEANNSKSLEIFQHHLALRHVIFGESYAAWEGNAVISRYPFRSHEHHMADHRCRGGMRSILRFQLEGDHPFLPDRNFAVTHLDYLNEDDRLAQMSTFAPHRTNTNILMGDMNAITREDYSDQYYREIVYGKREETRWELPRFDLIRSITETFGFRDAFREMNPDAKDELVATCPYGTRIDYIFYRPIVDDSWTLRRCSLVDTLRYTDHKAVLAEFQTQNNP